MTEFAVLDADGREVAVFEQIDHASRAATDCGGSVVQRMSELDVFDSRGAGDAVSSQSFKDYLPPLGAGWEHL